MLRLPGHQQGDASNTAVILSEAKDLPCWDS
jgi:hypothetical protein